MSKDAFTGTYTDKRGETFRVGAKVGKGIYAYSYVGGADDATITTRQIGYCKRNYGWVKKEEEVPMIGAEISFEAKTSASITGAQHEYWVIDADGGTVGIIAGKYGIWTVSGADGREVSRELSFIEAQAFSRGYFPRLAALDTNAAADLAQATAQAHAQEVFEIDAETMRALAEDQKTAIDTWVEEVWTQESARSKRLNSTPTAFSVYREWTPNGDRFGFNLTNRNGYVMRTTAAVYHSRSEAQKQAQRRIDLGIIDDQEYVARIAGSRV